MNEKETLISNIDKIHTTVLGIDRIRKNINLHDDVVKYIINKIKKYNCVVYKNGKNYYCEIDNIKITINSRNFCIITAHFMKRGSVYER